MPSVTNLKKGMYTNIQAKCSGTQPCDWCKSRHTVCVYEQPTKKRKSRSGSDSTSFTGNSTQHQIVTAQSAKSPHVQQPAFDSVASTKTSVTSLDSPSLAQSLNSPTLANFVDAQTANFVQYSAKAAHASPHLSDYFPPLSPEIAKRRHSAQTVSPTLSQQQQQQQHLQQTQRQELQLADASAARTIQQPYFRWLGPTAIAPPVNGTFRLLSVNISNSTSNKLTPGNRMLVVERQDTSILSPDSLDQNLADLSHKPDGVPLPPTSLYKEFYQSIANFIPFMPYDVFKRNYEDGTVCECVLYAMGAVAERFLKNDSQMSESYADMAKELVIPHLAAPALEIVFTLLLLAYLEFAHDRDSGLWAWSGMAIRMCYDLGLHKESPIEDPNGRQIFWSVVCLDRQISCGTGRKATIPDEDIEHTPQLGATITGVSNKPDPFPYLCKLMLLLGKVSNCFNSFKESPALAFKEQFAQFQQDISDFYISLPAELLFDVENFQEYARLNYSQVFLELHIWNQALVLAVHHPSLVYPRFQLESLFHVHSPYAHLTGTGAISIADMITFADLIDSRSFLACPMMSQPILMAACAALSLFKPIKPSSPSLPAYTLQRTFETCKKTLGRMQVVWGGISWHRRMLDSLAASEADVDLSVGNVNIRTGDLGILRKASVDEATRKWVAEKIQSDQENNFIHGLFISGTIHPSADPGTGASQQPNRFFAQEDNLRNAVITGMDLGEFF